jgi:RimJ/RimL family protein N-acetyltransferase
MFRKWRLLFLRGVISFDAGTAHNPGGFRVTIVETDRLTLRHLERRDAGFILELLNDPAWIKNIGNKGVRTRADAERYIEDGPRAMYAAHGFGLLLVELRQTGEAIGLCGLLKRDWLEDVDIGFAFLPAYRGRGYAADAARAVLQFAERSLKLRRVVAITSMGNESSVRLLGRLGFRSEGVIPFPGEPEPVRLFSLDLAGRPQRDASYQR